MRLAVALVGLVGCGRLNFDVAEQVTRCSAGFGPWENVQRLDDVSTVNFDLAPALHPDGLVLVFDTIPEGPSFTGFRTLMISTRGSLDETFPKAVPIAGINLAGNDNMQAGWTRDGKELHFHRLGAADERMVAEYNGGTSFGAARLSDLPNMGDNPTFSADNQELWFTSYGPDANVAYAKRTGSSWMVLEPPIGALRSPKEEGYATIDEQTLYFERDDGNGKTQIFSATRRDEASAFEPPSIVTELAITNGKNGDPEISSDGSTMIFVSDRPGASVDLFSATRRCQ